MQVAQVVPWEVHLLECIIVLSSRGWQHGCFARSTRTLQGSWLWGLCKGQVFNIATITAEGSGIIYLQL
jgi:hypothetical protein